MIDGPFLKIRELDTLRDYTMRPRILGFDGKWALHPDQVKVINEVFTPTQEQFDRAFDILDAYEKATTEGDRKGAVMFGDEMIDEASRKMANKFVIRGERAGMSRSAAVILPTVGSETGSQRRKFLRTVGSRRAGYDAARAFSVRRRAMTRRHSVSSAPSKIDSTRASTKKRDTGNSSA